MSNNSSGSFYIRGTIEDITSFLLNEVKGFDSVEAKEDVFVIYSNHYTQEKETERVKTKDCVLMERHFLNHTEGMMLFDGPCSYKVKYESGQVKIWGSQISFHGIKVEPLIEFSRKYNLDFEVYSSDYLSASCKIVEIQNGEVTKNVTEELDVSWRYDGSENLPPLEWESNIEEKDNKPIKNPLDNFTPHK